MTENCTADASVHVHQEAQAQRMMGLLCFAFAGIGVETQQPWTPAPLLKALCELNLSHSKTVVRSMKGYPLLSPLKATLTLSKMPQATLTGNKHSMWKPSGNNHLSPNLPGSPVTSLRPPEPCTTDHGTWLQLQQLAMGPHQGGREHQPLGDCLGELTWRALLPLPPQPLQ